MIYIITGPSGVGKNTIIEAKIEDKEEYLKINLQVLFLEHTLNLFVVFQFLFLFLQSLLWLL